MSNPSPAWLEVALTVNGELAEAVAEVFARFAPGGVALEAVEIIPEEDGFGRPGDDMRVCAYLPIDEHIEDTRQRLLQALAYLGMIEPLPPATFTPIIDQNWMEAWKERFIPIDIGHSLRILPAWMDDPGGRIPIRIDVGMAFGTGTHPTTQLSLALLEDYVQPDTALFDIGCGSGILSVAAVRLGASAAYGADIDPDAIANALTNAELNGVAERTKFIQGSVADFASGAFPVTTAPVVVANILTHILIRLLDEGMGELVAPGGVLLLSGVLDEKEAALSQSLAQHGFTSAARRQMDDWLGFAAQRI
jgi:ribosomal protein L11 methyltransferase